MGFIGDDVCILVAGPSPRIFNLYGSAKTVWSDLGRFPELDPYRLTAQEVGNDKAVYAVNNAPDHRIVSNSDLRVLILLDRSLPVGEVAASDPARVVALASSTTVSFLPGSGRPLLSALSTTARQLPVIRLSVGQDPVRVSELISSIIDRADTLPRTALVY